MCNIKHQEQVFEQLELPFMDTDPWLDERDLSDIIREDQETYEDNPCAYMAIPIEAMDKLETDLGLLKELVRRGQTDKTYRFIEVLEEELFDKTTKEV